MSTTLGGMTLDQWRTELATLTAARDKTLQSQEYQVGQGSTARRTRRVDFEQLQAAIVQARNNVASLEASQSGVRRVYNLVPR
jgi:hypothetical protein